jgi:hypothetical protein
LFIHSSVGGYLGYFYLLSLVTNVAMKLGIQIFEFLFSILFDVYLVVKLMGFIAILCLTFTETKQLFSTAAAPFYIPTRDE